ncbi:hypothetical protein CsSME_00033698 [Camellia sinensis var. sinensis]
MMSGCGEHHHPLGHSDHNLGHHSPSGHNEHDSSAACHGGGHLVTAGDILSINTTVMAGDIIFIMFTVNITDMVAMVVVTMEDVTAMVRGIMVMVVAALAKRTIAMADVEVTARDIIIMWSSLSMSVLLKLRQLVDR